MKKQLHLKVTAIVAGALMMTGLASVSAVAADQVEITAIIQKDGVPVADYNGSLQVMVYDPNVRRWEDREWVNTDENGIATAHVEPGDYRFCFSSGDGRYRQTCYGGGDVIDAQTVPVTDDFDLGTINLGLKDVANTSGVTVKGRPVVGQRVSLDVSTITPDPEEIQIYWIRDPEAPDNHGGELYGQMVGMGDSYLLKPADEGHMIAGVIVFVGPNVRGRYDADSDSTFDLSPTIGPIKMPVGFSGAPSVFAKRWKKGGVASYRAPLDLPANVSAQFQWLRDGRAIAGQTGAKHKISKADRGKRLALRITYSRPGYADTVMETASSPRIKR
ncbi:MAG TPA: hypothetical protein PKA04_01485 [Marmoricola sp.]|nr:hypothetical protein [Marmoricola sp.]HMY09300.1 hypothetical protein [Marmoricola sp.]